MLDSCNSLARHLALLAWLGDSGKNENLVLPNSNATLVLVCTRVIHLGFMMLIVLVVFSNQTSL